MNRPELQQEAMSPSSRSQPSGVRARFDISGRVAVITGISTSGGSPNVIRGLQVGRSKGAMTIGFTGASSKGMQEHCDLCFRAPADSTPRIQELHLLAWHAICELIERELIRST